MVTPAKYKHIFCTLFMFPLLLVPLRENDFTSIIEKKKCKIFKRTAYPIFLGSGVSAKVGY